MAISNYTRAIKWQLRHSDVVVQQLLLKCLLAGLIDRRNAHSLTSYRRRRLGGVMSGPNRRWEGRRFSDTERRSA